ncbi:MAG: ABC transporter ATP-binding protein [Candidatus Omnitrophica bacterium]|jgi:phospholipid/cholesterol/gamma-HCH transport system ATP-binding protein|nr:ABC transporter ATP-binding protein [Candidatus Omnitrophota bacterium]MDD5079663.1 ABC transporter ATP-binding protein [Candidatus Omnitrophota bacterium]
MVEIQGLYKSFNSHQVLNDLNLFIKKGTTLVVIGRSGCGKSVMLKHMIGVLRPDSGRVFVDGQNIWDLKRRDMERLRKRMNMVFQGGALFDSLTVGENVGFELIEEGRLGEAELRRRVKESLGMVDLSGIEGLMPSELSGGMRKRVSLARAICTKPELLLYDEPTTGVDPITADSINELIRSLHDKLNVTSIVVTHDMKSAYKIADRIAMLYQGRIIAEGTPSQIQNTDNPVVSQFINGLARGPITESTDN